MICACLIDVFTLMSYQKHTQHTVRVGSQTHTETYNWTTEIQLN